MGLSIGGIYWGPLLTAGDSIWQYVRALPELSPPALRWHVYPLVPNPQLLVTLFTTFDVLKEEVVDIRVPIQRNLGRVELKPTFNGHKSLADAPGARLSKTLRAGL